MAGFETHIGVSTVLGIGYGVVGYYYLGLPAESCALGAGLCSLSGMIPDLDSDTGTPVRETMTLTAAIIPMLLMDRFKQYGWSHEFIILVAASIYLTVRFGVAELFKRFSVHRGMWHSVPACLIAGLIAFLLVSGVNLDTRVYKACAVILGFMSHLVLDEIWSFSVKGGRFQIKKSFGTAIKFWGKSRIVNGFVYANLALVAFLAIGDPVLMAHQGQDVRMGTQSADVWLQDQMRTAGLQPIDQPLVQPPQPFAPPALPPQAQQPPANLDDWRR